MSDFPKTHFYRRILIIDDDRDSIRSITEALEKGGYDTRSVTSGPESLHYIEKWQPHIVLIDSIDPELGGLRILTRIRERMKHVSCIFISKNSTTEAMVKCLEAGADDYIIKPFNSLELVARMKGQIRIRDLQDQIMATNEKLSELIEIDDLTGLFNMRSLYHKLELEIERGVRFGRVVSVVMLDVDNFKSVNDGHDHLFGSYVISQVGRVIKENTRNIDIPARYGGDEFLIVLAETNSEGAQQFCEKLRKITEKTIFDNGEDSIQLTLSLGFATMAIGESISAKQLVKRADRALYQAKELGRNRVCKFIPDPNEIQTIDPIKLRRAK